LRAGSENVKSRYFTRRVDFGFVLLSGTISRGV
jgi:hypothetical protein